MGRNILGCCCLSLLLVACPLGAQEVVPVGPELLITDSDDLSGSPAVAADAAGNFMVVWTTYESEIRGQLFDVDGDPQGPAFQVNSYTTGGQGSPAVTAKGDDEFVVVWFSAVGEPPEIEQTLEGQRFQTDGTPVGSQFPVTPDTVQLFAPSIAATAGGEFVVVWRNYDFVDGYKIRAQRMSADGMPLNDQFQVGTYPTNRQYDPQVAADADGNFVVAWESYGSYGDDNQENSIQARRFDSSGVPRGDQFQVNTQIGNFQDMPAVGVAEDGTFVVAWRSAVSYTLEGQRYDSDGTPQGGQFQLNDPLGGSGTFGRDPVIASGPGDAFLVAWRSGVSLGDDTVDDSIQARFFPAGGGPGEPLFQVNSYTTGDQNRPAVATTGHGEFLVTWREPGVRGQFLEIPPLFVDGFESGDTSAWTNTNP